MTAFVLVPGAWHGGWWYDPLVDALEADGHIAIAITLAGLEDKPQLDRLIESLSRVVDEKSHSGGDGPVFGVGVGCSGRRRVTPLL